MSDLVQHVGLQSILDAVGVPWSGRNFEEVYSDLVSSGRNASQAGALELAVESYFSELVLPDGPTLYDQLVLSLREKDFIATFNWDPLLWQAIWRCRRFAPVPRAVALHGSVALGYCDCDKPILFGERRWPCERCKGVQKPLPLLYPVAVKDYTSNPLIAAGWQDVRLMLGRAYALTIFGYSAPSTDVAAVELMKQGWGNADDRRFEEIEVIDIKKKSELAATWRPFIHSHHWGAYKSLPESYLLSRWPRRSCESLFNATMMNDPDPDNGLPEAGGWDALKNFLAPLIAEERKHAAEA